MEPLTDTDPEASRVQSELLRRASPERRLRLALSLSRSVLTHEGKAMLRDTRARSGRVLGVLRASRSSLDRRYMDDGAHELRVADLLARALAEADRD